MDSVLQGHESRPSGGAPASSLGPEPALLPQTQLLPYCPSFLPSQTRLPSQSSTAPLKPDSQDVTCLLLQIKLSDQVSFSFLSSPDRIYLLFQANTPGKTSLSTQSTHFYTIEAKAGLNLREGTARPRLAEL